MKIFLLLTLVFMTSAHAQDFESEAKALAHDLKSSLMKNLSEKMAKDGPVKAISFCHEKRWSINPECFLVDHGLGAYWRDVQLLL